MIKHMKRKNDEYHISNVVLTLMIFTLLGSVAAIGYYLIESISYWGGFSFFS